MKVQIIRNINYSKLPIFKEHLIMVKNENNWTLSPLGKCDFLITQFHGWCNFLIAPMAERPKNSIFYHRITLNIIRKKYPQTDKKQKSQCHKIQENSKKMLEFRTKNRYKPLPLLVITRVTNLSQTCHKSVTNQSQICHKPVTNQSQKRQFWTKVVTFGQE